MNFRCEFKFKNIPDYIRNEIKICEKENNKFSDIVKFLNGNTKKLTGKNIKIAYDFFNNIIKNYKTIELSGANFGFPSDEFPESLTPFLCYLIIGQKYIEDEDKLYKVTKIYLTNIDKINHYFYDEIFNKNEFIDVIIMQNKINDVYSYLYDEDNYLYNKKIQIDFNSPFDNFSINNEYIVYCCAMNFFIDISRSNSIKREYNYLTYCIKNNIEYTPLDKWMNFWHSKNKNMFDLNLYYNHNFKNLYEKLGIKYNNRYFYKGVSYELKNYETEILYEDVFNLLDTIICYKNDNNDVIAFTEDELLNSFKTKNSFENPSNNEIFSMTSIMNLKNICGPELKKLICEIEFKILSQDEYGNKLAEIYRKEPIIKTIFIKMLELGMYMRGWKVISSEYPLHSVVFNDEEFNLIQINVCDKLREFEKIIKHSNVKKIIYDMPMFYFDVKLRVFVNHANSFALKDIINSIKIGENNDDIPNSCIRTVSNYIISTSYKNCSTLGLKTSFSLDDMINIF
jgi:hypothetical protein